MAETKKVSQVRETGKGAPARLTAGKRQAGGEAPRKKNYRLHQSKIDRAMRILGTRTETETIEQALDMIVFRDMLVEGVRALRVPGDKDADWLNVFGEENAPDR